MNKKIIILLILIAAIAAVFGVWFFATRQTIAPAATNTPVNTPAATSTVQNTPTPDETADWLTYANAKNGFSFKYPATFGANVWHPTQWPPAATVVTAGTDAAAAGCPNLQTASDSGTVKTSGTTPSGIEYTLYTGSDIGAGQLYSEYCYIIAGKSGSNIAIDFIIQSHSACGFGSCGAYCATQYESECTNLDRQKDIISPIQRIIDTITISPKVSISPPNSEANGQASTSMTITNPPDTSARFVIAIGANGIEKVADDLISQGFISNADDFKKDFDPSILALPPGGYKLSKGIIATQIAKTLQTKPYMKWIIIPEGLRKEETADMLARELGWNADQKQEFARYTAGDNNNIEGVYFPDTYLIPINEAPTDVAKRLITKFNEKFAAYLPEFNQQNIKWTTGLSFASIVQREAANDGDMPLIAGILWNRLEQGMELDADATLQYARGDSGNGWWAPAAAKDKQIDSPYNTYLNKGLPPHPICSPGIAAIEATLNPAQTDCLYYLHDSDHATHCAKTYEEHLENIKKYL